MNPQPRRCTYSFVLTLLSDSQDKEHLRGRVRAVATDEETSFTNIHQLLDFCFAQLRTMSASAAATETADDADFTD